MSRILVIEDDPSIRKGLMTSLKREGYEILAASDGLEGYRAAQDESIDLILLDVMLPGKDGREICRDLREKGVTTPILMLTARNRDAEKAEGLELGADDYLTKPFSVRELAARVKILLKRGTELKAAAARAEQFSDELEIARQVQENLFPRKLPELANWKFAGICRPARAVGGDYYDLFEPAPSKLLFALGDVSGKGLGASLLMSAIHAFVRSRASESLDDPLRLILELNRHLLSSSSSDRFATLFLGVLDVSSGHLRYVNCAHPPPFLVSNEMGTIERLSEGGTILGALDQYPWASGECKIGPGGLLTVFSDGVTEATSPKGEQFGEPRLAKVLTETYPKVAPVMLHAILDSVYQFTAPGEQTDDISLVVIHRVG